MDATTTRASTVIRSMPTREILTQASITMPLSNTRSSTSMRLEPPDTRSTAIEGLLHPSKSLSSISPFGDVQSDCLFGADSRRAPELAVGSAAPARQGVELSDLDRASTSSGQS